MRRTNYTELPTTLRSDTFQGNLLQGKIIYGIINRHLLLMDVNDNKGDK